MIQVDVDNRQAAADMTAMLIEQGYSRFAIITGDESYWVNMERINGFRDALTGRGLPWERSVRELSASPSYVFTHTRDIDHADGREDQWTRYPLLTAELGGGVQVTRHRRPVASDADASALS